MSGVEECETCGKTIPSQPVPVKEKYGGYSLCDKCKGLWNKEKESVEENLKELER